MENSKRKQKLQLIIPRNRKKKTLFALDDVTDEVLQEILIRLSTNKEETRCKLVCIISSQHFHAAALIHPRNNHDNKTLLPFTLLFMRERTSLEYVKSFLTQKAYRSRRTVDLRFLRDGPFTDRTFSLAASSGDLILLRADIVCAAFYYICNIVTRQWTALPPAPSYLSRRLCGESVGFFYEPFDNDDRRNNYVVLRFSACDLYFHEGDPRFDVDIFSSDKGAWTRSVVMSPPLFDSSYDAQTPVIACGGKFYTLNYRNGVAVNCIFAFDPFTNDPARLLHTIDLPFEAPNSCRENKLGLCRGRLHFAQLILQQSRYPCITVWELEDYRRGKWTLLHKRIPTNQALRMCYSRHGTANSLSLLAFHPCNKDLLCFLVSNDLIVVYNIRTDKVESSTRNSLLMQQDRYPPRSLVPGVLPITYPTVVANSSMTIPLISELPFKE